MKNTRKLLLGLLAGTTLAMAAPVFADSYHDRGYDRYRHEDHFRGYARHYDLRYYGGYVHHRPVIIERPYVVQRAYVVEQPVYYSQPAPNRGIGAMIGAAIGGMYDNRQ